MVEPISSGGASGNYQDPTQVARQDYAHLYEQFLKDTQGDPSSWDHAKIQKDIDALLKFMDNPHNEKLLQHFANTQGTPAGKYGTFSDDYGAAKRYLKDFFANPEGTFEFTHDVYLWINYRV